MNIHYDLVNQFPIQQKGFCCVVFCFVFVYFVFVLFCCFCFVFVCLFVFSIHLKSWNEWCSHTKTSKLLRKWETQNGGSDLAPQLLGEHIILQVLLDRGHDFFLNFNFFKVTKIMLGVIHKGWGHKVFWLSYKGVGLEQKLPKVFQWKLIFMSKRGPWNLNIVVLCIQTSIALHQPTFANTAFCTWPPALRTQYIRWPMCSNEVWMHH